MECLCCDPQDILTTLLLLPSSSWFSRIHQDNNNNLGIDIQEGKFSKKIASIIVRTGLKIVRKRLKRPRDERKAFVLLSCSVVPKAFAVTAQDNGERQTQSIIIWTCCTISPVFTTSPPVLVQHSKSKPTCHSIMKEYREEREPKS